ncbi:hypothetical protein [Roseomonas indoligenes]|uniref:Uncharacterized protein n=1 Tax=Roseomonas indoligenes TaxID=2820811 RepID=A0A940MYS1_9PROT|nr:hypothetical protein [Pararoseomonas indoligenes]MBP0492185.1 hypothetical protein [Pararoseomonas indoligenes]
MTVEDPTAWRLFTVAWRGQSLTTWDRGEGNGPNIRRLGRERYGVRGINGVWRSRANAWRAARRKGQGRYLVHLTSISEDLEQAMKEGVTYPS